MQGIPQPSSSLCAHENFHFVGPAVEHIYLTETALAGLLRTNCEGEQRTTTITEPGLLRRWCGVVLIFPQSLKLKGVVGWEMMWRGQLGNLSGMGESGVGRCCVAKFSVWAEYQSKSESKKRVSSAAWDIDRNWMFQYMYFTYITNPCFFYFTFYFREQTRVSDIKLCRIHKRKFAVRTHAHRGPREENGPRALESVFPNKKGMSWKIFSGRFSIQLSLCSSGRVCSNSLYFGATTRAMCERVLCSTHVVLHSFACLM